MRTRAITRTGPFGVWGADASERDVPRACDRHLAGPDQCLIRAVDVDAPAAHVFRWLCQLRIAPYSYDRIDNGGRRSPRTLTPGLDRLEPGQRFMRIFRLAEFEPERSITLTHDGTVFGRIAVTYEAIPAGPRASRLLARVLVRYPPGPLRAPLSLVLPAGDLVMMRKQLLTLRDAAVATRPAAAGPR